MIIIYYRQGINLFYCDGLIVVGGVEACLRITWRKDRYRKWCLLSFKCRANQWKHFPRPGGVRRTQDEAKGKLFLQLESSRLPLAGSNKATSTAEQRVALYILISLIRPPSLRPLTHFILRQQLLQVYEKIGLHVH